MIVVLVCIFYDFKVWSGSERTSDGRVECLLFASSCKLKAYRESHLLIDGRSGRSRRLTRRLRAFSRSGPGENGRSLSFDIFSSAADRVKPILDSVLSLLARLFTTVGWASPPSSCLIDDLRLSGATDASSRAASTSSAMILRSCESLIFIAFRSVSGRSDLIIRCWMKLTQEHEEKTDDKWSSPFRFYEELFDLLVVWFIQHLTGCPTTVEVVLQLFVRQTYLYC